MGFWREAHLHTPATQLVQAQKVAAANLHACGERRYWSTAELHNAAFWVNGSKLNFASGKPQAASKA